MKKSLIGHVVSGFFKNLSTTNWLIIANIAVFIIVYIISLFNSNVFTIFALKPLDVFHGKIWQLLTSMFMHANFGHLFVNMFSLFFIGTFLERIIGRKRFIFFYLIAGIVAGIIFSLLSFFPPASVFGTPETLAVGASGALFGLLGVLAIITPKARVYLILGPLVAIILQYFFLAVISSASINAIIGFITSLYFLVAIFAMVSFNSRIIKLALPVEVEFWLLPIVAIVPLVIVSFFISLPIGNTAHFGGLIAGLICGWYLRNKYKKKVFLLNRMLSR